MAFWLGEAEFHGPGNEFDMDRFERIAAALGMFSDEFLASMDRAEKDIKAGRVHKLKSLADLM